MIMDDRAARVVERPVLIFGVHRRGQRKKSPLFSYVYLCLPIFCLSEILRFRIKVETWCRRWSEARMELRLDGFEDDIDDAARSADEGERGVPGGVPVFLPD